MNRFYILKNAIANDENVIFHNKSLGKKKNTLKIFRKCNIVCSTQEKPWKKYPFVEMIEESLSGMRVSNQRMSQHGWARRIEKEKPINRTKRREKK